MTITPQDETQFETAGRRRKITKFALAGVAVLGVGAALTSAAWTDNVWFGGTASSGTINLTGSVTGQNGIYLDSDDEGAIELAMGDFVLAPDSTATKRVWVQNQGTLPVKVTLSTTQVGALFGVHNASVAHVLNDADGIITPGQKVSIDVSVSTPNWDEATAQGELPEDNTIVLRVAGSSDLA